MFLFYQYSSAKTFPDKRITSKIKTIKNLG